MSVFSAIMKMYKLFQVLQKNWLAMEAPVCSLKHLTASPPHLPSSCDGQGVLHWSRRASYRLFQIAVSYFIIIWIVWVFPPIYNRLSETEQAVVFTLVDTASAELQNRAASSPTQPNTDALLSGSKNENLSIVESTDETKVIRPPVMVADESIEADEETSKNLSILKDGVDNIFNAENEQYIVRAEPKIVDSKADINVEKKDEATEEVVHEKEPEAVAVTNASLKDGETVKSTDHEKVASSEGSEQAEGTEDIPSFSEWAQKQLAEAEEKKKVQNATTPPSGSTTRTSGSSKIRSKNYASPDCGAKIVGTNPEAMNAGSIISPSQDEYVLNACTNRFWFVVELCEAIQAKKIELANFELFSSSPRDFSVSISDRFPSRDWRSVGHFTAQDERDIQSFSLDPHLFGKFIKVELHSHYGSEHYCPISLFRVYGTSEFEVLETEVEVHESVPNIADDDDDEEPLDADTGEPPKTLFGSAQDAVLSIVKKAAQVLVKSGDSQNVTSVIISVDTVQVQESENESCVSPSHIVVCDNCSDAMFNRVFDLLSCRGHYLQALINTPFVRSSFQTSKLCSDYGLDFGSHRTGAPYPLRAFTNPVDPRHSESSNYLSALFPREYVAALCNILAIFEKKVVFNISYEINGTSLNLTGSSEGKSPNIESNFENLVITPPSTCTLDASSSMPCSSPSTSDTDVSAGFPASTVVVDSSVTEATIASQIKPTKTLVKEPDKKDGFPSGVPIKTSFDRGKETVELSETPLVEELPVSTSSVTSSVVRREENQTEMPDLPVEKEDTQIKITVPGSSTVKQEPLEVKVPVPETEQLQSDKQTEAMFDDKFQESQDNLSLDSILSQMKDLEMPADVSSSAAVNPSVSTTTTVPPPNLAQTQQAQKESVFVRLSNRIKVLERNMSLSGQYLEELSRRYKKQVEEMQRAFNRTLAAVGEESRKGEEREQKRMEEMAELQKKLDSLTSAVQTLLQERDSWQQKMAVIIQHVVLIVIEVMLIGVFLYFCRNLPDAGGDSPPRKWSFGWRVKAPKRRRSVDGTTVEPKKIHDRRPSEEALHICGTYTDLLITDPQVSEIDGGTGTVPKAENKRRRRKKKDGLHKSSSSANLNSKATGRRSSDNTSSSAVPSSAENDVPARRASSSEIGSWWGFINGTESEQHTNSGSESQPSKVNGIHTINDPETTSLITNGSTQTSSTSGNASERESPSRRSDLSQGSATQEPEKKVNTKEISGGNSTIRQGNGTVKGVGINPTVGRFTSPFFVKTAMSSRSSRIGNNVESSPQVRLKSDNWEWYSSRRAANLEKSSQGTTRSPTPPSAVTLHNGSGHSHTETEDMDRTSEASVSSVSVSQKDSSKKGSGGGGLKKMVKKFF